MYTQGHPETKRRIVAKIHESFTTPSRKTVSPCISPSRKCIGCVAKAIFPPFNLNSLRSMRPTPNIRNNPLWTTPATPYIPQPQLDLFERPLKRCSSVLGIATSKPGQAIEIKIKVHTQISTTEEP
ncbi:hypothetical protein PTI98_009604 [Pleurotus ostreatus]|nr:hypothetical protein PTI98_009604 [Pleurotus ostreatus]